MSNKPFNILIKIVLNYHPFYELTSRAILQKRFCLYIVIKKQRLYDFDKPRLKDYLSHIEESNFFYLKIVCIYPL